MVDNLDARKMLLEPAKLRRVFRLRYDRGARPTFRSQRHSDA